MTVAPAPHERSSAAGSGRSRPAIEGTANWCAHHAGRTIAVWLVAVITVLLAGTLLGHGHKPSSDPGESGQAQRQLRAQPTTDVYRENVLIQSVGVHSDFARDPALQRAAGDLVSALQASNAVTKVRSPLGRTAAAKGQLSADGHSGLVTFDLRGPIAKIDRNFVTAVNLVNRVRSSHADVRMAQAGDASVASAVNQANSQDLQRAELFSVPLTLVILLVIFGALVAAGIPVLLSIGVVAAALGAKGLIGHVVATNHTVSSVVVLVGMAVGVDYSLFYLRRWREERAGGATAHAALLTSARTSGKVVVTSGLTVMLSVSGLFLTGIDVFYGISVATMLVVGLAVLSSVTVLPALVSLLGERMDAGRLPFFGRRSTSAGRSKIWTGLAGTVTRHPIVLGGLALIALLALAAPGLSLRSNDPAVTNELSRSIPAVDAMARIGQAFPGGASPAQVVVWGGSADTAALNDAITGLHAAVAGSGGALHEPISVAPVGSAVVLKIPLAGSGTDTASNSALTTLRNRVLPDTLGRVPGGLHFAVTGSTAAAHDFGAALHGRTPLVFGFVLVMAFAVLAFAFRSPTIPLISIVLNLLSITASFGVLVIGFQDGHLGSLLNFTSYGGIISWVPLFMFVVLFGLSMDYHVFILSRVREAWSRGMPSSEAVAEGVGGSAGVVTSAAVVMISVFLLFASLSSVEYKMLGVGMASAILIDATLVRGILLPAALTLLGDRAWRLRRDNSRRPTTTVESPTPALGRAGALLSGSDPNATHGRPQWPLTPHAVELDSLR